MGIILKHFFRFFTILLVITFSIIATESYGQDQNGLYLSVVKQTPPSSSIIEICSGENIALYGNTSGTAVERLIFEYYNKTSNTWQVLSSTFRNFDFSNVGAFAFKEALPDNIESQDYRLRYFINQVEYITPNFSINVRPGSSAGGISPRTYTICYGSSPPDLTLQGTVGTTIRWQSSFTSSTGTYTDMSPAITTVTLPGSAINNFQTGYYRAIVQNSYCTPDTLSVPITITVTPLNTIGLSSASGTESQTVCISTPIANLTFATTGATGATSTTLPTGLSGSWSAGVFTVSGTPTVAGTYSFTITTTGGCGVASTTASLVVTPNNTITLSSVAGTDSQTVCINTAITSVTYTTTGATGATFAGLPAGVSGAWLDNIVTISGTPTASGTFTYTITLTGGCGVITKIGTIKVNALNTIGLSSAVGTESQIVCINTPITNLTYATITATGASSTTLPAGLNGSWSAGVYTVSGTPTVAGTYSFTITTTGGCGVASTTASLVVTPNNTITQSSAAGTDSQTVCINTAITSVTYTTTGATGATFAGLPAGVDAAWSSNVVTISGTPTASGTFTYTITLTGGCGVITKTGTIVVTPNNTITLSSAAGTNVQTICINGAITNIRYTTTIASGATVTGLPTGLTYGWSANALTISGTVTVAGTYTYTATTTGGCSVASATGTIVVTAANTIGLSSAVGTESQTVCISTAIANLTFATTGATGATSTTLPTGLSGSWSAGVFTVSGTPTVAGTYSFTITTSGGCGVASTTASLVVTPNNTITLSSATGTDSQTVCINTAITSVTYTTTGATNATFAGLPAGVDGAWLNNIVTISGTPTVSGTYNYTITLTGGCGIITKNGIIVVSQQSVAGNVAITTGSSTICSNSSKPIITLSGNTGLTIKWQSSLDGTNFSDISPAQTERNINTAINNIASGNTQVVTYYLAIVKSGACPAVSTSPVSITVDPIPQLTAIVSNEKTQQVCIGISAIDVNLTTNVGTIVWKYSSTSGSGYLPFSPNQTNSTLSNSVINTNNAGTTYYKAFVTSGVCAAVQSEEIVVRVDAETVAGSIASASNLICNGSTPPTITLTGNTGSTIKWQTRLASATYVDPIASQTGSSISSVVNNIAPASSQVVNYYQAIVKSGACNPLTTNEVAVAVDPSSKVGLIEPLQKNQEICIGSSATSIVLPSHTGTIQWQTANLGGSYADITGLTNATLLFGNIATNVAGTKIYRAQVTSGVCPAIYSEIATVQVDATTVAGDAYFLNGNSSICNLGDKPTISIKNNTGTNIVWQITTVSNSNSVIGTANSLNYTNTNNIGNLLNSGIDNTASGAISSFKYYRASVRNGVCKTEFTQPIELEVIPTPIVTKVVPAERCGLGNVEILAESNLGIPNWFEANSGGAAIVSANTFITPLLNSSTNYYAGAIFRGCVSFDRTAVLAKIKPIPSVTSVINANNCGPGNLELSATVSGGIVNWFTDANAGSSLLTAPKYTTPSISNTTTYYAEALLDGCTSSPRTPVVATIFEVPTFNPLPDLFSLCAGLRLSLSNYVALGAPPYNYIFNTNNGNVMGQKDGYLLGVKGGITDVYFNVKDMNGCISQNTNSFQVKTYDPVKPKIFFQEAFYDFSTIIKTKVDSGYSVYDWSPTMNLDFYNDKDPVFRGIDNVTYALYRLDTTSNCSVTDTYNITITTDFIFNLPNAFTPNFDGLNDVIKSIYNSGIASLNFLKIYNRNGNIVFQTSLLAAGWDGRVNGVDQDADAYYWTAEYVTKKSETFRKSGSFLLIK